MKTLTQTRPTSRHTLGDKIKLSFYFQILIALFFIQPSLAASPDVLETMQEFICSNSIEQNQSSHFEELRKDSSDQNEYNLFLSEHLSSYHVLFLIGTSHQLPYPEFQDKIFTDLAHEFTLNGISSEFVQTKPNHLPSENFRVIDQAIHSAPEDKKILAISYGKGALDFLNVLLQKPDYTNSLKQKVHAWLSLDPLLWGDPSFEASSADLERMFFGNDHKKEEAIDNFTYMHSTQYAVDYINIEETMQSLKQLTQNENIQLLTFLTHSDERQREYQKIPCRQYVESSTHNTYDLVDPEAQKPEIRILTEYISLFKILLDV